MSIAMNEETKNPQQLHEESLRADVFNGVETDWEYFQRRQRELAAKRKGTPSMITCAGCGGRYEDAPGNFCSFCV